MYAIFYLLEGDCTLTWVFKGLFDSREALRPRVGYGLRFEILECE